MDALCCTDRELLVRLIGEQKVKELYEGSLAAVFKRAYDGEKSGERLVIAHELVRRWLAEGLKRGSVLSSPQQVSEYLRVHFAGKERECFVVLFLDSQHRLIAAEELACGTIDGAAVYPREVVKAALRHNAAALIYGHNHPSGIAEPSAADRALTERLRQALAVVDIRSLDHVVVGSSSVVSFAERGWM
ncbi:JAB domain-containing protein [Sinimarinibacterium flocculans]|uniref:JAB domain-containing protein n=1 Tax=Sinimarinibacterium flocculans TaxID=985250 RepID=UPI003514722F